MKLSSKSIWITFLALLIFTPAVFGQAYDQEKEAKEIEGLLMSPCCWGGTVAEHNSQAAIDIKKGIRKMLDEGKTRPQILAFYEEQYGERILSAPKKTGFNLIAWILPFVIFIAGTLLLMFFLKRMRPKKEPEKVESVSTESPPTSEEDEKYRKEIDKELYG